MEKEKNQETTKLYQEDKTLKKELQLTSAKKGQGILGKFKLGLKKTKENFSNDLKEALFAVKQFVKNLQVQPFSLLYKDKNGKSLSPAKRDYYAFYQGIPFGKHFWDMCCQSGIQIHLKFHSPIENLVGINRKDLAEICYQKIRKTVLAK